MTATDDALREAASRLLSGAPLHSDGALTVQNLAIEAGISRASAYRSPVLVEFRQCVANQEAPAPGTSSLRDENRDLRAELKELRSRHAAEAASLQADADGLLQLVQVLTVEREALRRQVAQGGTVSDLLDARRASIAREGNRRRSAASSWSPSEHETLRWLDRVTVHQSTVTAIGPAPMSTPKPASSCCVTYLPSK